MIEQDKDIEKFADRLMGYSELDTPTFNFRANILYQLEAENKKPIFQYKPLIAHSTKWIFTAIICFFVLIVIITNQIDSNSFLDHSYSLNYGFLTMENFLPQLHFSSILLYSIIFFAIFFWIQIGSILKSHKRSLNF